MTPASTPAAPRRRRRRRANGEAHPVDIHIGQRLRERRMLLGLSQERLGELLGLTFQQVQKYERGANRVSGSRLWEVARALDCPVSFFFDQLDAKAVTAAAAVAGIAEPVILKREMLELARAFSRIDEPGLRHNLRMVVEGIADLATNLAPRPRKG